jgi:hypothetical protein
MIVSAIMSPARQLGGWLAGGYFGINPRAPTLLKVELIQTTTPLLLLYLFIDTRTWLFLMRSIQPLTPQYY